MRRLVLVVESDNDLCEVLVYELTKSGFNVQKANDGIKGEALALQYFPDLIILDLILPNVDGLTLCQRLRRDQRTSLIPIIFISELDSLKDKVKAFNAGADDYITKPFYLKELHVRIKASLLRFDRSEARKKQQQLHSKYYGEILNHGPLTLIPDRFEAIWFESPVRLTFLEFELLYCLLQRHGQTVSPSLILKEVWWYEPAENIDIIRTHIRRLRTKLEPNPRKPKYIKSVYGDGYCLELSFTVRK